MPDLFDAIRDPAAHHTGDPMTSIEALDSHEESGARSRNQRLVHYLVSRNPGCTAVEIWENADPTSRETLKEMQEVRRRLTDLERKGLVKVGAARKCTVRGTKQQTYTARH